MDSTAIRLRMKAERHSGPRPVVQRCAACGVDGKITVIVRRADRLHVQCAHCLHVWAVPARAGQP